MIHIPVLNNYFFQCTHRRESVHPPLYCLNVSHIICGLKNYWLISQILQYFWFSFADFSILYIQSFVYTVYDELTGQRQGPGPSGKSITCCHSHITTTKTDTGEQPTPTTGMWSKHSQRQTETKHQCAHSFPWQQSQHTLFIIQGLFSK